MANKNEITFELAIAELQTVVEKLEAGKVALEDALALYERGVELVKICNERLDLAQQRVSAVRLGGEYPSLEGFAGEGAQ
jgi:exodeoxyribonuclease VII small subunit